jgi:hypothetical protein
VFRSCAFRSKRSTADRREEHRAPVLGEAPHTLRGTPYPTVDNGGHREGGPSSLRDDRDELDASTASASRAPHLLGTGTEEKERWKEIKTQLR